MLNSFSLTMINQPNTVSYPAQFTKQDDGTYRISFRDVPEAVTHCDDISDAVVAASYVLRIAFEHYREYVKQIPAPSPVQPGEVLVSIKRP